jgi:glutamate synthase (NADPH/NADH) large chain
MAALMGADEFGLATASLVVAGCIMLRKCHLNTCSVGIATQDPTLRARFQGRPDDVVNFFFLVAEGVRRTMAQLGFRRFDEMVGRVDLLRRRAPVDHWKAKKVDLSAILAVPQGAESRPRSCERFQYKNVSDHFDHELLKRAGAALEGKASSLAILPVTNAHRAVGAMLSGEIARRYGSTGLPDDSVRVRLTGSAGQSFGAFLARGVTLELEGDANDYVGKGLSGGRLILYPPAASKFAAAENVIIGNVALYGATSGEVYVNGLAGERFAVRNSGARAVIDGVGDHGCEYMTGGVVVVLGQTGRNFAAGMSGGVAYVFDRDHTFRDRCNLDMVELESLAEESEAWLVRGLIENHARLTGSAQARRILDHWDHLLPMFVKVMPVDYKRVLQARKAAAKPPVRLRAVEA